MLFSQRIDSEIAKLEKKLNEFCNIQEGKVRETQESIKKVSDESQ
jgi:hypothetical protein